MSDSMFESMEPVSPDDSEERDLVAVDLSPECMAALADIDKGRSHLTRENYKASVEHLCDAVNRIAVDRQIHGYATY